MAQPTTQAVLSAMRGRKTIKVLADEPYAMEAKPVDYVDILLDAAQTAPYHRPAHASHRTTLNAPQPWRYYIIGADQCRQLAIHIETQKIAAGKIPEMLRTADLLIQATWLPDPGESEQLLPEEKGFAPTVENMEHIAAASAAIQNTLVAASAADIPNYWCSGGVLRTNRFFDILGIAQSEILLGSLFFFPQPAGLPNIRTIEGALRATRGGTYQWSRSCDLKELTS